MTRFGAKESNRKPGLRRAAQDFPGISIDAAWHIDGDTIEVPRVYRLDPGQGRPRPRARPAGPDPGGPPAAGGGTGPGNFAFNGPNGAGPTCTGLGVQMEIDELLVVPNRRLSINEGAIVPYQRISTSQHWYRRRIGAVGEATGFTRDTPLEPPAAAQWASLRRGPAGDRGPATCPPARGRGAAG